MGIEWNIDPSVADEAAVQKARLDAELARLGATPVTPKTESQDSPPTESQESLPEVDAAALDPALVERVYVVQASHERTVQDLAEKLVTLLSRTSDPDIRACAIGRALLISADPNLVFVSYELERESIPQKGDRVREENGAVGTVVALKSLTEVVVKWDHEPRAMVSLIKYLTPFVEDK